jgi:hypothetical protein
MVLIPNQDGEKWEYNDKWFGKIFQGSPGLGAEREEEHLR